MPPLASSADPFTKPPSQRKAQEKRLCKCATASGRRGVGGEVGSGARKNGEIRRAQLSRGAGRRKSLLSVPSAPARREATSLAGCAQLPGQEPLAWATEGQPHPLSPRHPLHNPGPHQRENAALGRRAGSAIVPPHSAFVCAGAAVDPRGAEWAIPLERLRRGGGTRQERGAGPANLFQIFLSFLKLCFGRNPVIKVDEEFFFFLLKGEERV